MNSQTVQLDPNELSPEPIATKTSGSELVYISPSAYDVPSAITIDLEKTSETLALNFRYFDKEEPEDRKIDERLTLRVGKNSGKLIGIVLNVNEDQLPEAETAILHGIDMLQNQAKRDNQKLNYRLVRSVLAHHLHSMIAAAR